LTDHDEIRRWADARGAKPACVKGTGSRGDTGMIRLDFPGFSGGRSLQPITWKQWFKSFDENGLSLLVQDETARGQRSNFNKLVARRTAERKQKSRRAASGSRSTGRKKAATREGHGARARKSARTRKSTAARRTTKSRRSRGARSTANRR
jgi:hypothetical protein